jgi:hypothetical protein
MQILAPAGFVKGLSIGTLFGPHLGTLRAGIYKIVYGSFISRGMRNPKASDVKERIGFCIGLAAELYLVKHWSIERIVDELPAALKARLDGTKWEPSNRMSWAPTSI